jgi:hypothetical protein
MKLYTIEQKIELHEKGLLILENILDCDNIIRNARSQLSDPNYIDFKNLLQFANENLEKYIKIKLRLMGSYNKHQMSIMYPECLTVNN